MIVGAALFLALPMLHLPPVQRVILFAVAGALPTLCFTLAPALLAAGIWVSTEFCLLALLIGAGLTLCWLLRGGQRARRNADHALGLAVGLTLALFVVLASWASAIALFQARLAHASYTAGPPLEWPESPSAEAITNLSSSSIP